MSLPSQARQLDLDLVRTVAIFGTVLIHCHRRGRVQLGLWLGGVDGESLLELAAAVRRAAVSHVLRGAVSGPWARPAP
ncbi:MAG: hypothetical protein ACLUNZ_02235 [Evtepia sp.]